MTHLFKMHGHETFIHYEPRFLEREKAERKNKTKEITKTHLVIKYPRNSDALRTPYTHSIHILYKENSVKFLKATLFTIDIP